MAHALCMLVTRATDTHSDYALRTYYFSTQQRLCERAAMLRLYVTAYPVLTINGLSQVPITIEQETPFVSFERVPPWILFRKKFSSKSDTACQSGNIRYYYVCHVAPNSAICYHRETTHLTHPVGPSSNTWLLLYMFLTQLFLTPLQNSNDSWITAAMHALYAFGLHQIFEILTLKVGWLSHTTLPGVPICEMTDIHKWKFTLNVTS